MCQQDLERMLEDNGGIREKEPFFLSRVYDIEVFSFYNQKIWTSNTLKII